MKLLIQRHHRLRFSRAVLIAVLLVICFNSEQVTAQRRRKITTPVPFDDLQLSLVDRERNLEEREKNFRLREDQLVEREQKLKEREDKISAREANVDAREKNTGSATVCKEEEDDMADVRLNPATGKLVEIGSTESCPANMRFFALPESEQEGDCDCDHHQCARPLIYSAKYAQCFWAWTQGPCEQREWYVYNATTYEPICEPNPCPESPATGLAKFYFRNPEDGGCYQSTTKGYCKGKGERLFTAPGEPIPACRKMSDCAPVTVPDTYQCYPGYKRWQEEKC